MRSVLTTLVFGSIALAGSVEAAEPIASPDDAAPATVTQSTTTTVTTTAPAALPPPPVVAAPPAVAAPVAPVAPPVYAAPPPPVAPYAPVAPPVPPSPPMGGASFQGPIYYNGPVWIVPAPNGQPLYMPPPAPPQVYVQPPVYTQPLPYYSAPRPPIVRHYHKAIATPQPKAPRGPVVGVGLRFAMMGISSQQIFGEKLNLYGAGLQLRFRNQGRFGFEISLDAMRGSAGDGAFVRASYPFSFAPMFYIFKNHPDTHFNIYGLAGFGLVADDITLYPKSSQEKNQQFWEVMAQAGAGVEVRLKRLALFTDIRAIGLLLDDSSPAGQFYRDVDGGPIPPSTFGYRLNAGALLWF